MELSLIAAMCTSLESAPVCCRDAEVLSLFAAIINKLGRKMEKEVPRIFEAVFQVTLDMITKNFEVGGGFHVLDIDCGDLCSSSAS